MSAVKRAKIVHLSSVHKPFDVRIFQKECRSLARIGYKPVFIVRHTHDEFVDGVQIRALRQRNSRLSRATFTGLELLRKALHEKGDLYHFHDFELMPIGLLLTMLGKKVIYDVHEDVPGDVLFKHYIPRAFRKPVSLAARTLQVFGGHWIAGIVAATSAIRETLDGINPNVITIHNRPLLGEITPALNVPWKQRGNLVAYVGGINEHRGIREMVKAMELIAGPEQPRLELAGTFWPSDLRTEVIQMSGWAKVNDYGFVNRTKVAEILGRVRAGLLIHHPIPNHIRSEPNKLFEYMAAGLPVIASDFPFWRTIIEKHRCGLLVDPFESQQIARAIQYLLSHPEEAYTMGQRGREAVEREFNWKSEEPKLFQFCAGLLKNSHSQVAECMPSESARASQPS